MQKYTEIFETDKTNKDLPERMTESVVLSPTCHNIDENEHFVHRHSTPIVHDHTNFTHEMNGSYIPSQINSKSLNTDILNKAGEAQYTVCNVDTHVGSEQNTCNTHIYDTNSSGCAAGSSNVCNKTCSLYTPSTSSNVSDYREHVYSNTGHTNPNLFGKTSNTNGVNSMDASFHNNVITCDHVTTCIACQNNEAMYGEQVPDNGNKGMTNKISHFTGNKQMELNHFNSDNDRFNTKGSLCTKMETNSFNNHHNSTAQIFGSSPLGYDYKGQFSDTVVGQNHGQNTKGNNKFQTRQGNAHASYIQENSPDSYVRQNFKENLCFQIKHDNHNACNIQSHNVVTSPHSSEQKHSCQGNGHENFHSRDTGTDTQGKFNQLINENKQNNQEQKVRMNFENGTQLPCFDQRQIASNAHLTPAKINGSSCTFQSQTGFKTPRKLKEPDLFDGQRTEWPDYICHFEQVAQWNGWSDNEKAAQLAMSLRGVAQRVLSELSPQDLCNYDSLKNVLRQRFCPPEYETAYRCEFRNRRRNRDESAADYGYALKRLGNRAFPSIPLPLRESLIVEQYVSGLLNPELKRHVQFAHPKTLDRAISLAVEFEAFEGAQLSLRKPRDQEEKHVMALTDRSVRNNAAENDKITNMEESIRDVKESLKQVIEKIDKPRGRNDQFHGRPNRNKKSIQCFNCGKHGHYSFDCRSAKINRQDPANQKQRQNQGTATEQGGNENTGNGDLN